jgi:hypothetical protein
MADATIVQVSELPDYETCWALLERVAASSQLKRAARLQGLLLYLGRRSLKDGSEPVHEQQIGVEVFRRPRGYDTGVDNIVRTSVSDLRKRIDAYFESEGSSEILVMQIPRWSYIPVFRYRKAQPLIAAQPPTAVPVIVSELAAAAPSIASVPSRLRWTIPALIAMSAAVLVLAIVSVYFWARYERLNRSLYPWRYEPSVAEFWGEVLNASPDTDVVLADASFGLLQDINKKSFPFSEYQDHSYISQLQSPNIGPDLRAIVGRISMWNLGDQDDFKLARRILALDPLGAKIHLYNARSYLPDLTKRDNVILIGGRISNPWDDLFESHMNFVANFETDGSIAVINHIPATGEQKVYSHTESTQYCVVAYLPNPDHHGIVLLVEGTGAEATEAAGDFLLSEYQLSSLKKLLHVSKLPYFEVLLKVSSVPGTPLTASIEAFRGYPNLH